MKNLKKVLALVLVVATLMSFATVASATFTDASSIEYKEAVDVLSGINVINGYTDGSFRPEGNVTRAQMAKMVAYIVAGGEDVGSLYAGANSFSDCTTHWAKGYIAYANKTGIVAGVGGGKFNPDGSVTGTQAAKMMLCALGYDSAAEGYTGTNWSVNVLSDARDAGLLEGLETVNMSVAMTREQAAQLMFNALKADMVEYDRGNINIDSGDTSITIGGSAAKVVTSSQKWAKNIVGGDEAPYTVQLGEKYFQDLTLIDKDTTVDNYGRPAHEWKYEKDSIGAYADEAVATYTEGFDKDEVANLEKDYDFDADTKYYVNGAIDSSLNAATIAGRDYKGTVIELFADDDDDITHVALIQAYAAEVTTLTKTTITLKVYNPWLSSKYTSISFKDDTSKNDDNFDTLTASYEKGDYLLTYFKGADVKTENFIEAAAIKSFDAKVSTTKIGSKEDGYNGYFTVDGTKYTLASGYNEVEIKAGSSYTFYTDANGYVIAAVADSETAASINDVYYIAKVWSELDTSYGGNETHWYAQLVNLDGTISEVELETKVEGKDTVVAYDAAAVTGNLVSISDKSVKDSKGDIVCKASNDKYNVATWTNDSWDVVKNVTGTFAKSDTRITVDGTTYRLNSDTKYLLVSEAGKDLSASVKTGGIAYTIKTGDPKDFAYIITEDDSAVVKYVVIGSPAEISEGQTYSKDAIYLAAKDAYEEGDGYYAHTVYLPDGTSETWQLDAQYEAGFYTYDKNSDGYYTLKEANEMGTVTGVWDEQEGVITGEFKSLFETLVTVGKTEDIETKDAVVVDVHDTGKAGQYDATISTLDELSSLKTDNVITSATLTMNVAKDGAVVIFITDVVAGV